MTQEEKELLLKDLYARLPYGVKVGNKATGLVCNIKSIEFGDDGDLHTVIEFEDDGQLHTTNISVFYGGLKPYLRPISSMTGEEYATFPIPYSFDSLSTWNNTILSEVIEGTQILIGIDEITEIIDWFLKYHFDYRGLIPMGLAIAVTEENNPYK